MKIMNKNMRCVALGMASMLCFTACAGQAAKESSESKDSTQSTSQVDTSGTDVQDEKAYWELLDSVSDTSELPDWTGDTLEVTVWLAGSGYGDIGTIPETDVVFKELERVTGIKFNVDECFDNGGENIDAKLPMVISSNDYPTIIIGGSIEQQYRELFDNGYLADLTEYYNDGSLDQLQKYMPMEEADSIVYSNARTEDGQYYLIPFCTSFEQTANVYAATGYEPDTSLWDANYYNTYGTTPKAANGNHSDMAILVHEDVLKALIPDAMSAEDIRQIYLERGSFTEDEIYDVGMDSREDFIDFLYDVQELLSSGDWVDDQGRQMEVMAGAHTETDNWQWMVNLPGLVDNIPSGTNYFVVADYNAEDESQLLEYAYENDYYMDWMKMLNTLVKDDVISQNSLLDNAASFQEKCANSHYAVLYAAQYLTYNKEIENYRPIWIDTPYNDSVGGFSALQHSFYFGIFKDALSDEELDQLVHAINYMYSEVGSKNFYWGPASAGLFTEDEDGNRTYNDPELAAAMLNNEQNGKDYEYGLLGNYLEERIFQVFPRGPILNFVRPSYLTADEKERGEKLSEAFKYYNPGTLPGKSVAENATYLKQSCNVYGTVGTQIEGMSQFWAARSGFENQVKKVIAADSEAEYEKQYNELLLYCEENGLTEEALQEFNDAFVEYNRDMLINAGLID